MLLPPPSGTSPFGARARPPRAAPTRASRIVLCSSLEPPTPPTHSARAVLTRAVPPPRHVSCPRARFPRPQLTRTKEMLVGIEQVCTLRRRKGKRRVAGGGVARDERLGNEMLRDNDGTCARTSFWRVLASHARACSGASGACVRFLFVLLLSRAIGPSAAGRATPPATGAARRSVAGRATPPAAGTARRSVAGRPARLFFRATRVVEGFNFLFERKG